MQGNYWNAIDDLDLFHRRTGRNATPLVPYPLVIMGLSSKGQPHYILNCGFHGRNSIC